MSGRNIGHSRPRRSRGRNLVLDAPRSLLLNLRNHDGDLGRHAATVHALASLAQATSVHSAIHVILLWYCPNCHKKMEKLALM